MTELLQPFLYQFCFAYIKPTLFVTASRTVPFSKDRIHAFGHSYIPPYSTPDTSSWFGFRVACRHHRARAIRKFHNHPLSYFLYFYDYKIGGMC